MSTTRRASLFGRTLFNGLFVTVAAPQQWSRTAAAAAAAATSPKTTDRHRPLHTSPPSWQKQMPARPKPPPDSELEESYLKGSGPGGQKIVFMYLSIYIQHTLIMPPAMSTHPCTSTNKTLPSSPYRTKQTRPSSSSTSPPALWSSARRPARGTRTARSPGTCWPPSSTSCTTERRAERPSSPTQRGRKRPAPQRRASASTGSSMRTAGNKMLLSQSRRILNLSQR